MIRFLATSALLISSLITWAQNNGIQITTPNYKDFQLARYEKDTTAGAVVLQEFAEAYIDPETFSLIYEYHVKIKILRKEGLEQANYSIDLYKSKTSSKSDKLKSLNAMTYNFENNRIVQSELEPSKVFTENRNERWDVKKFTLPNVKVGSVIKISYEVESHLIFNFRNFEFQSDIPKIASEYWAKIPGNYVYNITLIGYQKLSKNENSIVGKCIEGGGGADFGGSGYSADCILYKFGMKDVPAFHEETHMTAKKNFISAINFELSEVKHFDGRVDKYTKTWKDAETEFKKEEKCGAQLRKGKDIEKKIEEVIAGVTDETEKARKIYAFIQTWYTWNENEGLLCEFGLKKSFDERSGNVADINFSLIVALTEAGLLAEPVAVSTRDNGLVIDLHPVLSDFNYVIARLKIGDRIYLLDATNPYLPFGMLPEKCLNGKGRLFGDAGSAWENLAPTEKRKSITVVTLTLQPTGVFIGTIEVSQTGYKAFEKRKLILSYNNQNEYLEELKKDMTETIINKYEVEGLNDLHANLIEKFEVEIEGFDMASDILLFDPFFIDKFERNPFRSVERLFPVDYGVPEDATTIVYLTYPSSIELISAPEKNAFTLPNSGGKFLFEVTQMENKLTINYLFTINKTVFNAAEYRSLKEFYNRIIQIQNTDFLFKKKK